MATDPTLLALLLLRLLGELAQVGLKLAMIKAGVSKEDLDKLQKERKEVVQEIEETD